MQPQAVRGLLGVLGVLARRPQTMALHVYAIGGQNGVPR